MLKIIPLKQKQEWDIKKKTTLGDLRVHSKNHKRWAAHQVNQNLKGSDIFIMTKRRRYGRQNNSSRQGMHILAPQTYEYVRLRGKEE